MVSSLQAAPPRQEEARELAVGALTQYSVEFANAAGNDFHREVIEGYRPQALEEVRRRQAEVKVLLQQRF